MYQYWLETGCNGGGGGGYSGGSGGTTVLVLCICFWFQIEKNKYHGETNILVNYSLWWYCILNKKHNT